MRITYRSLELERRGGGVIVIRRKDGDVLAIGANWTKAIESVDALRDQGGHEDDSRQATARG